MNTPRPHKALLDMSRRDLARWARNNAQRDELVRQAAASGLPKSEIFAITGIARTTIDRILATDAAARHLAAGGILQLVDDEPAAAELVDDVVDVDPEDDPLDFDAFPPEAPLVVISCGAGKLDHAAPARELYTGSYFRLSLAAALAIARPEDVRILSAKHGVLRLDDVVEPYDTRLGDFDAVDVGVVVRQLADERGRGRRAIALCGVHYADLIRAAGLDVVAPLHGLGIGRQRSELARIARERSV